MYPKEKARLVGFRYEGKKCHAGKVKLGRKDTIDFQKIEKDVNKMGEKLFREFRLMNLR